ncbi:MAG: prenyltransferase/squalene oxidase repeat-containing protein [Sedimentibacter sp.]|uniref:prenyltransferase/squalene oxidase repeat-containing protein n=1 Tax=Sedimentibacter sp. TaxID=1960295 RepID=UPI003159869C
MNKKNYMKCFRAISIVLCLVTAQSFMLPAMAATAADNGIGAVMDNVSLSLMNNISSAENPWSVIGLARSGKDVPDKYYDIYVKSLEEKLKSRGGVLNQRKYSEYSSAVLALTALGKDPADAAGYNLLEKLSDYDKVVSQGINGAVWALIALDAGGYAVPQAEGVNNLTSREKLVDLMVSRELPGGGWSMGESNADPDVTAMVLQSLSSYMDREDVKAAADRAVEALSRMQKDDGGFESWGYENSESASQVLVALCSLGIDPARDVRFVKNGNTVVSNLINKFYKKSAGGFMHTEGTPVDELATNQAFYAIAAYERFLSGKTNLYDMSDVNRPYNESSKHDSLENPDQKEFHSEISPEISAVRKAAARLAGMILRVAAVQGRR